MIRPATLLLAAAFALTASGTPLLAASPPAIELDQQVRCTIIFGLVAGMQDHHSGGSERFAPMDRPGMKFMSKTIDRLQAERGIPEKKVQDFFMEQVKVIVPPLAAEKDTDAAIDAEMAACLPLLDQVVPDWRKSPAD